ncbi:hypothetical protein GCM10010112_27790 [Actinoplanes lobatus]|nr:hypothetical protein GCM10010112_27790 [Actinoplanes lobatus]
MGVRRKEVAGPVPATAARGDRLRLPAEAGMTPIEEGVEVVRTGGVPSRDHRDERPRRDEPAPAPEGRAARS